MNRRPQSSVKSNCFSPHPGSADSVGDDSGAWSIRTGSRATESDARSSRSRGGWRGHRIHV